MNNPSNDPLKLRNCMLHNEPITFYSLKHKKYCCQLCLKERDGLIPLVQLNQQLQELQIKGNKEYDELKQQLKQLWDSLLTHKQNINSGIEKILQLIIDQISFIESFKEDFSNKISNNIEYEQQLIHMEDQLIKIQNSNNKVKEEIIQQILQFQLKFNKFDYLLKMLKQNPKVVEVDAIAISKNFTIQEVKSTEKNYFDRFEYELIEEFTQKEDDYCRAFAFNSDNNIFIVGCENQIIVYEFNNGKIQKELQRLSNHTDFVTCLYFMKQSNGFVSGGDDKQIIIWSKNNVWVAQSILSGHIGWVSCLIMNIKEDLLITGSRDSTIKFWRKNNNIWNCQQTINVNDTRYALSLNEDENKLISCGFCSKILIFEIQQKDQQWIFMQAISVKQYGLRLCFTFGNKFVFQPKTLDYLEIYDYDNLKKQFSKVSQIQVQECKNCRLYFPCQFIKQLNILTVKHGNLMNIFKVNRDGNYQLMQKIKYEHDYIFCGCMTDDGQYLVTWDYGSKEIQVRQLKFKTYLDIQP